MSSTSEMKWYMIRVVSGKENKAIESLTHEINNSGLGRFFGELYLPKEQSVFVRNGKKIKRDKVTYPGYVMIRANMNSDLAKVIKSTNNVNGFAGDVNGNPIALRQSEVDSIFNYVTETYSDEVFRVGDEILVKDGPFNGFKGQIEKNISDKSKLLVNVLIFGRLTALELSYEQVEKVKE